jgi:peptidoglycan hydrolase-like protein with peptidoglycan-binding domain
MKFKKIAIGLMMGLLLVSSVYAAGSSQSNQQNKGAGPQGNGMQNGGATTDTPVAEVIILEVQQALNDQGYDVGKPDGKVGPSTQKGLRDFQKSKGLPQTGQPDKQTQAALGVNGQSSGKGGSQGSSSQKGNGNGSQKGSSSQGNGSQQGAGRQP